MSNEETLPLKVTAYSIPEDYLLQEIKGLTVSCGQVGYCDVRRRKVGETKVEIFLSPGLSIVFDSVRAPGAETRDVKVNFHFQQTLYYSLKDLRFVKSLYEGCEVKFNSQPALRFKDGDAPETLKPLSLIPRFEDLNKICSRFGIDPKLFPVTEVTESAWKALGDLASFLYHGGSFSNEEFKTLRHSISVGGYTLQLLWLYNETEDKWEVRSLFDSERIIFYQPSPDTGSGPAKPMVVTPFELLTGREISRTLNLNPEKIIDSYRTVEEENRTNFANGTVLKLLHAADLEVNRRSELLAMAERLNDWIIEAEPENVSWILNRAQIKYRLGTIGDSDLEELEDIRQAARRHEYGEGSVEAEAGAAILLGRSDGVDYLLDELDDQEREKFEGYPIYFLHKNQSDEYIIGVHSNVKAWEELIEKQREEKIKALLSEVDQGQ